MRAIGDALIGLIVIVAAGAAPVARAANWIQLQGVEAPNAPQFRFWGFAQPAYEAVFADRVSGAKNQAFNGKWPTFNRLGPDNENGSGFLLKRARVGARGVIAGTDRKINYMALVELAHNGITKNASAAELTDASMTFSYIPGMRVRVGQFKYPGPQAALQSLPLADPYVEFATVTSQLIMGRHFEPALGGSPAAPVGAVAARQQGGVDAFRDSGVQLFDWFKSGQWEYTYAAMLGSGSTVNNHGDDANGQVTVRLQTSRIFGGAGPFRRDFTAWLWYQTGTQRFAAVNYTRRREGLGLQYNNAPLRVTGEYMQGAGMIFDGVNPPFNYSSIATITAVALGTGNKAHGWYLESGYDVLPKLQLDVRYDFYDRLPNNSALERRFSTWTLGAQYFFTPKMRVTLNYAIRSLGLNPSSIANPGQRANAQAIADSMGNLLALQASLSF